MILTFTQILQFILHTSLKYNLPNKSAITLAISALLSHDAWQKDSVHIGDPSTTSDIMNYYIRDYLNYYQYPNITNMW